MPAIDVHAHYFDADLQPTAATAPRVVVDTADAGRIMCGDTTFRQVNRALWDVSERLRELDVARISHQVISPVPVAMEHAAEPDADPGYARATNDSIAAACAAAGGRLFGLGCLPFGDVDAAIGELARCLELGLRGVEIGTRIGDLDLDAPDLAPFWAACDDTGAAVFVHPVDGGEGVLRRAGQPYDLGLGMVADTALAAGALVFGGVLARHENLRVALAHGGGAYPWAYPRLSVAATLRGHDTTDPARWAALTRRLYADTLVFDDEHLRLLTHRFGPRRLVLGSDAPFFPDQLRKSMRSIDSARESGALPPDVDHDRLAGNALDFLGLPADS